MNIDPAVIAAIHRSGHQMVLAMTGGGASAIGELLRVSGGSASVLEAVVPYSWASLVEYLGGAPDHACSARTARAMAMKAFLRARQLAEPTVDVDKLLGVGLTASLASDRPKRGAHRFHLAIQSAAYTDCFSLELEKDKRTRAEEEAVLARVVLRYLALNCRVGSGDEFWSLPEFAPLEISNRSEKSFRFVDDDQRRLLLGELRAIGLRKTDHHWVHKQTLGREQSLTGPRLLMPGAFHPIHEGHRRMAAYASARFGRPVAFELSIENVEKPPLDYVEIAERLNQLQPGERLWLTRAPTFLRKSELFLGATFIVGVDTIVRVGDPKYAGSVAARDQAITTITERGCRFLVFGRASNAQQFEQLDDVTLPPALRAICDAVPESEFRVDLSSTELRRQQEQQQQ
jgi:hypothetical protein